MKHQYRNFSVVFLALAVFLSTGLRLPHVAAQSEPKIEPDDTFGIGGKRITTSGTVQGKGRVVEIVIKDPNGRERRIIVKELRKTKTTDFHYDKYGFPIRERTEEEERDDHGELVSKQVVIFDAESKKQVGGHKEEVKDGKRKISKWNPKTSSYEQVSSNLRLAEPKKGVLAQGGYNVDTARAAGLNIITFATPNGKINVNLTDDLAAGDRFSGTVVAEPAGRTAEERARNSGQLQGCVIEMDDQQTTVADKSLTRTIPVGTLLDEAKFISLVIDGKEVARSEIPIKPIPEPEPTERPLPTGGQMDRPIEIQLSCNGVFNKDDFVRIGGKEVPEIAESPRKKIVRNTSETPGVTEIECKENGQESHGTFRIWESGFPRPTRSCSKDNRQRFMS